MKTITFVNADPVRVTADRAARVLTLFSAPFAAGVVKLKFCPRRPYPPLYWGAPANRAKFVDPPPFYFLSFREKGNPARSFRTRLKGPEDARAHFEALGFGDEFRDQVEPLLPREKV